MVEMELKQNNKTGQPRNIRNGCQVRYKGEKNDTKWNPEFVYKLICLRKCEKHHCVTKAVSWEYIFFFLTNTDVSETSISHKHGIGYTLLNANSFLLF